MFGGEGGIRTTEENFSSNATNTHQIPINFSTFRGQTLHRLKRTGKKEESIKANEL